MQLKTKLLGIEVAYCSFKMKAVIILNKSNIYTLNYYYYLKWLIIFY